MVGVVGEGPCRSGVGKFVWWGAQGGGSLRFRPVFFFFFFFFFPQIDMDELERTLINAFGACGVWCVACGVVWARMRMRPTLLLMSWHAPLSWASRRWTFLCVCCVLCVVCCVLQM